MANLAKQALLLVVLDVIIPATREYAKILEIIMSKGKLL